MNKNEIPVTLNVDAEGEQQETVNSEKISLKSNEIPEKSIDEREQVGLDKSLQGEIIYQEGTDKQKIEELKKNFLENTGNNQEKEVLLEKHKNWVIEKISKFTNEHPKIAGTAAITSLFLASIKGVEMAWTAGVDPDALVFAMPTEEAVTRLALSAVVGFCFMVLSNKMADWMDKKRSEKLQEV